MKSYSLRPVVSAPLALLLLASLALTASPAAAGSYSDPNFSGGYWTFDDDPNFYPFPQANPYAGDHEDANFCGGDLTATSTWVPVSSTDPSPAPQVIVTQKVEAYWDVRGSNDQPTASCADGFGDTESYTSFMYGYYDANSARTNHSVQAPSGNTVTVTCSGVSATMDLNSTTPPVDDGDVGASWGVTLSPVTINLVGGTPDGNGGQHVLVGQKVNPSLVGIPDACTVSNYQWTVTGTTMQSWTVSPDLTHTTEADGSGDLTVASSSWFWNDPQQASETILCTATVTPPVGEGSAFGVRATLAVGVYLPTWSASGNGGTMNVRILDTTSVPGGNDTDYWPTSDPNPGSGLPSGMNWRATLAPPQGAPVSLGTGNIELVKLVTPSEEYINFSNNEYQDADQGKVGLDPPPGGSWPYGWITYEHDPYQPYYITSDSPASPLSGVQAIYGNEMDSFVDYIMYQPPKSSEYVPLGYFKWNVNGTATIPSTNNWANFQNPDGIVEPSGSYVNFTPSNTYPSWIRNSGDAVGFVQVQ